MPPRDVALATRLALLDFAARATVAAHCTRLLHAEQSMHCCCYGEKCFGFGYGSCVHVYGEAVSRKGTIAKLAAAVCK
jgi:hypothetical protein